MPGDGPDGGDGCRHVGGPSGTACYSGSDPMDLLPVLLPVLLGLTPAKQTLPARLDTAPSLQRTVTLSARFEQRKRLKALQRDGDHGQLHYREGGRLIWHTDPPSESGFRSRGRRPP